MGSQSSKLGALSPTYGTTVGFMFKNHGPSSCTLLTKWTDFTKCNLELQWPWWWTFDLPKLTFSKLNWTPMALKLSKLNGAPLWIGMIVQDRRTINNMVISRHPVAPNPCILLTSPEKANFLAALDLCSASSVFQLIRRANYLFAFTWEERKYIWTVMAQGFADGPYFLQISKANLDDTKIFCRLYLL